jgi:hypothetical protein
MPVIKPRTRGKRVVRHIARLDHENLETLHAYAQFIAEPSDYVLNQLVECVLGKDKEFLAWREQHAESFVPQPVPRNRKKRRRTSPAAGSDQRPAGNDPAPSALAG